MQATLAICVLAFSVFSVLGREFDDEWQKYKTSFNKSYPSLVEEIYRRTNFEENLKHINGHNEKYEKGLVTFKLGLNEYSDENVRQLRKQLNGYIMDSTPTGYRFNYTKADLENLPESIDWRATGYVTPIKNQGKCGSCWAFSTVASIEGQHKKVTGNLTSLSEQQLVDCSFLTYLNFGCYGGLMTRAFDYVKHSKGLDTEDSYPYKGRFSWSCKAEYGQIGARISGHVSLPFFDEDALKVAVANIGPISVAIDAGHPSFMNYKKGVYYEKSCSHIFLDHGVAVVGYGTEGGKDYWLVKNSWGTTWGEDGYVKMARNQFNHCGIATRASYPIAIK